MKYYIREIKPFIEILPGPGVYGAKYAVDGYDWVHEDREEELRNSITFNKLFEKLIFKERFVEVSNEIISQN